MSVGLADPLSLPQWDRWVEAYPDAFFFHGAGWARILRETYGHRPVYPCQLSGEGIETALPLMEVCSRITGRRGVSLPFTDFCPALGEDETKRKGLFEAAMNEGRRRRWRYLECRNLNDGWAGATPSLSFWGHWIDLTVGAKRLWTGLGDSVRRNVRKAQKAGLTVQYGRGEASMAAFFRLHCQTRKRHGLPPQPRSFFSNIRKGMSAKGGGEVGVAFRDGKAVAAAVYLNFGRRAFYKFGASDEREQEWRGNDLLMWTSMERFATEGFDQMHLGRTSMKHEGLRRFKLGFGPEEETIGFCRYDFGRECFVTSEDKVEGWHNRVFSAFPGPALRLAGKLLYGHLS